MIENLVNDKAALEKQLAALELKQVQQLATTLPEKAVNVNGINFRECSWKPVTRTRCANWPSP
ncbi:hypothetical protein MKQ70_29800 [Chitinophaga sedimenti]|uniref:hypothetical protein n=1 Tax=Chitinophaga sedimenti TaxID=2033606 RepID=UPI002002A05D|nr:hypothetical protein [Chitinophaga sedimenti]MCK7558947.1 hypothetical protein [Chitinophaga sedimenti]